ncbi:hypothetical protein ACIA5G_52190 [Amycolatopsis sp. NPDC051758]|uniref:hypothetical protein n=1 Tax=Amycolatopsis sp. NPDC051758 TaxID=3363935 RepID=UPI00379E2404
MITPATSDSSAAITLTAGEYWIELVPAAHAEPRQASFPAVIEPRRHHGLWVRPRLRREVAEAMCAWLNLVYPVDPDWYPLARFEGDLLVVLTGNAARHRHEIGPDVDGRYPLGELGRWFLSGPTRTPAHLSRQRAVLLERRYHRRVNETLVTCAPSALPSSAFPARIEPHQDGDRCIPVFRPEVAEAVAAFCAHAHEGAPDEHPLAYFDRDTLVHVHQHRRACDGYLPWRIEPGSDGAYRVDGDEWIFRPALGKSEGMVHGFRPTWPGVGTQA